jgi:hypothetical protein
MSDDQGKMRAEHVGCIDQSNSSVQLLCSFPFEAVFMDERYPAGEFTMFAFKA